MLRSRSCLMLPSSFTPDIYQTFQACRKSKNCASYQGCCHSVRAPPFFCFISIKQSRKVENKYRLVRIRAELVIYRVGLNANTGTLARPIHSNFWGYFGNSGTFRSSFLIPQRLRWWQIKNRTQGAIEMFLLAPWWYYLTKHKASETMG